MKPLTGLALLAALIGGCASSRHDPIELWTPYEASQVDLRNAPAVAADCVATRANGTSPPYYSDVRPAYGLDRMEIRLERARAGEGVATISVWRDGPHIWGALQMLKSTSSDEKQRIADLLKGC